MNRFSAVLASALFAAITVTAAKADTFNLASYGFSDSAGTFVTAPTGAANSMLYYYAAQYGTSVVTAASTKTYDLNSGLSPWMSPLSLGATQSSWVAQNPNDSVGGGHVEGDGGYWFFTLFDDSNAAASIGSLTVMADDTTSISLNGHTITPAASSATGGTCASGTPTCTTPTSYVLPTADFVDGTNYLAFEVMQQHESAEGLDFVGSVNVTPEPDSLLLLGTGLAMLAGFTYSRRVQA